MPWPTTPDDLIAVQRHLAAQTPPLWHPSETPPRLGACFACFPKGFEGPGAPGDRAWAAAVVTDAGRVAAQAVIRGEAPAAYRPGFLALREGPLLEAAVHALAMLPDVLLVDGTGRDHPRRAGLAVHLGAMLDVPAIGVTDRPLVAEGAWPPDEGGASSPLRIGGELVGAWVRTRVGSRPLVVHAAWRIDTETAVQVVLAAITDARTPDPLRLARRAAREARARSAGTRYGQLTQ